MSLAGQTVWVVGGVGVVGRGIARGFLKAGATVICNSKSTERLDRIRDELQDPQRLQLVHGSLLDGAQQTIDDALAQLQSAAKSRNNDVRGDDTTTTATTGVPKLDHVVAHGAVRYWTTQRVGCDETYSLNRTKKGFFDLEAQEFMAQSSQLAALHYSALQHLWPHLLHEPKPADNDDNDDNENGNPLSSNSNTKYIKTTDTEYPLSSYTFVTGDGSGHPSHLRSAMGEINSHHVWGLSAALRQQVMMELKREQQQEQQQEQELHDYNTTNDNGNGSDGTTADTSSPPTPLCREIRIGLQVNRDQQARMEDPRDRPLSEDIGDLCAGVAATSTTSTYRNNARYINLMEQGKLIRVDTRAQLEQELIHYKAHDDKKLLAATPLPSLAEFGGCIG